MPYEVIVISRENDEYNIVLLRNIRKLSLYANKQKKPYFYVKLAKNIVCVYLLLLLIYVKL